MNAPDLGLGPWPATTLLESFLRAVANKGLGEASATLAPDLRAVVPAVDGTAPVDRATLLEWIGSLCESAGTLRMDPTGVLHGTPDSVASAVRFTAFDSPGGPAAATKDHDRPYWTSWPTLAGANLGASGRDLGQLFFLMDDAFLVDRDERIAVVTGWYDAYVAQELEGFLAPLADDLEAFNYNGYQPPTPVTREDYHAGFLRWCEANHRGGSIVGQTVARGAWVGTVVQFLTEAKVGGQQKMTDEVHFLELDEDLRIRRAYFYETDRCGYPCEPCSW